VTFNVYGDSRDGTDFPLRPGAAHHPAGEWERLEPAFVPAQSRRSTIFLHDIYHEQNISKGWHDPAIM